MHGTIVEQGFVGEVEHGTDGCAHNTCESKVSPISPFKVKENGAFSLPTSLFMETMCLPETQNKYTWSNVSWEPCYLWNYLTVRRARTSPCASNREMPLLRPGTWLTRRRGEPGLLPIYPLAKCPDCGQKRGLPEGEESQDFSLYIHSRNALTAARHVACLKVRRARTSPCVSTRGMP